MNSLADSPNAVLTSQSIIELQVGTPDGPGQFSGYHFHEKFRAHDWTQISIYPNKRLTDGVYFRIPYGDKELEEQILMYRWLDNPRPVMIDIGPCLLRFYELRNSSSMVIRNLVEVWTRDVRDETPSDRKALQGKLNILHTHLSEYNCADEIFHLYSHFSASRHFDSRTEVQAEDGGYNIDLQLFCLDLAEMLDDNTLALAAMHEITHAWIDLPGLDDPIRNWAQMTYSTLAKLFRALPFSSDFLYLFRKNIYARYERDPGLPENAGLHNVVSTSEEHLFQKGWELVEALSIQKKIATENPTDLPPAGYTNTMGFIVTVRPRHQWPLDDGGVVLLSSEDSWEPVSVELGRNKVRVVRKCSSSAMKVAATKQLDAWRSQITDSDVSDEHDDEDDEEPDTDKEGTADRDLRPSI
ncbi:uncharacterized protein AB675_5697 [Cyphellophora attinorum]|uniref:Uncharacterized protein n=1 Tax=Cyphellophora attinorum TaxID=1664694 RepID=A0A0N1HT39_9EURO|nr:uncharacterized protein AB675_5697 [Phialophora attinorum]KPI42027.1 hypothetical protein AB675_5697 [Phialophora attinorum]